MNSDPAKAESNQGQPEIGAGIVSAQQPRRSFMTKLWAVIGGGIVALFPVIPGIIVFSDPLRKRRHPAREGGTNVDPDGFVQVAALKTLPDDGTPQVFRVIADRFDAWNYFPNEPVGAVYLRKLKDNEIAAFNMFCPHAGCAVDFDAGKNEYHCPCHNSSFTVDGQRSKNSPSARDLDSLQVDVRNGSEIWVKFQNFRTGTEEQIPVS